MTSIISRLFSVTVPDLDERLLCRSGEDKKICLTHKKRIGIQYLYGSLI